MRQIFQLGERTALCVGCGCFGVSTISHGGHPSQSFVRCALTTERVAELTTATTNTCEALNSHAQSLEQLTEKQMSSSADLEAIERSAANASAISNALRAQVESASEVQSNVASAATRLNDVIGGLQASVDGTASALQQLHGEFQQRLEELEKGPQSSLDGAR